jgi:S-formylglutathione hydrolase FrmB
MLPGPVRLGAITVSLALFFAAAAAHAARLEAVRVPGETLKDNPLGDPAVRQLAVFVPDGSDNAAPLPLVIYLPGWGGSSEDAIRSGAGGWLGAVVDRMSGDKLPVRIAVVDGRSRYGGSQFLNSGATGRYADYVSEEIRSLLRARYGSDEKRDLLAGHSSGAYGSLMLASAQQAKFRGVVALSPDSDFEVTHKKPLVQVSNVQGLRPEQVQAAMAPAGKFRLPDDGHAVLMLGLCANFAPIRGQPGKFEWLYDANGNWRPEAWDRWIDLDPLTLVRRDEQAFSREQRIYMDGAERDEFGAQIGARKIHDVLAARKLNSHFYEAPGRHSDDLPGRLVRGLRWVLSGK